MEVAVAEVGLVELGADFGEDSFDDFCFGGCVVEMLLEGCFVEGEDGFEFDAEGQGESGRGHDCLNWKVQN